MVKIHHKWQNMCCKVCNWRNSVAKCDFHGLRQNDDYCRDFEPKSKLNKSVILQMWKDHTQRFIRERQE